MEQTTLADLLAGLRRDGRQQSGLPAALVPPDHDTAYRVAAEVAQRLAWPHAGWKIAATKPAMQQALRTNSPIYGRVFAQCVRIAPATLSMAELVNPIVECEYVVTLARDLPVRERPYSQDEVAEAVASIAPGIEIAQCRFTHDAAFPPLAAILADGAGSGIIVTGAPITDWRHAAIADQQITLRVDGQKRRSGTAADALDHPLVPLTWLVNELSRTGVGLRAEEIVSTGTCTGMLRPKPGEIHSADFGGFGQVELCVTA